MHQKEKYLHDKKIYKKKFSSRMGTMWNVRAQDKGKHGKFESINWAFCYHRCSILKLRHLQF